MWTSQLCELFNQIGPPSSLPIRVFSCQCVPDFKINFADLAKCNRTNSIMPKKTQIVIQLIDRGTFFRWIHNSHWTGQLHKVSFHQTVFVFSQEKYKSQVAFLPGFLSINPLGSCDLGKLLFFSNASIGFDNFWLFPNTLFKFAPPFLCEHRARQLPTPAGEFQFQAGACRTTISSDRPAISFKHGPDMNGYDSIFWPKGTEKIILVEPKTKGRLHHQVLKFCSYCKRHLPPAAPLVLHQFIAIFSEEFSGPKMLERL